MCIRDRLEARHVGSALRRRDDVDEGADLCVIAGPPPQRQVCLLYTSDAADERSSVDLGGRRIIKKKITDVLGHGRDVSKKNYRHTNDP